MRDSILAAVMAVIVTDAVAQTQTDNAFTSPCVYQQEITSPNPAENPDGFGQIVGERGETNANAETDDTDVDVGDAYTGEPAYGNCDGR